MRASFAFEAECWDEMIPIESRFALTRVYRQRDEKFIDILEQMRKGDCSVEHQEILLGCDRPVNYDDLIEAVEL